MKAPFQPTTCSCRADRANCTRQPGHLIPGQLPEIMARLGKSIAEAGNYFWNSPGMVLGSTQHPGQQFRVRTITPRFENGKCVFYENGSCTIHAVAPFGCRFFDVHMTAHKAHKRSMWGVNQILDSLASYSRERDALPEATHYQPQAF